MTFADIINTMIGILNLLVPIIMALALVSFIYGIILYISRAGDENKRREGLGYIVYGIIGLFIMVSVWAIVGVLSGTFFGSSLIGIPTIEIHSTP